MSGGRGLSGLLLAGVAATAGCQPAGPAGPPAMIGYVGSSTVAGFLRDAEPAYGAARFTIDSAPESAGGERAIVAGTTALAGIARQPQPETLRAGIAAAEIGRDAIAVIVNAKNPITNLSTADLRAIFTGTVKNWRDLGGGDVPLEPFIVGPRSATGQVFAEKILGRAAYAGCTVIAPDRDIVATVGRTPGGIGQISFSFLGGPGSRGVRAVGIDGEPPLVTNFDYPVARPLYLLWREGHPAIDAFVAWARSAAGQRIVMQRFVGVRVMGGVQPAPEVGAGRGSLIVYTETEPVYDAGIYYYPHRSYRLLTREGTLVRRVRNHRGENDEHPTRIDLAPGTYLVQADSASGEGPEFLVTIEAGRTTRVFVEEMLKNGGR